MALFAQGKATVLPGEACRLRPGNRVARFDLPRRKALPKHVLIDDRGRAAPHALYGHVYASTAQQGQQPGYSSRSRADGLKIIFT